MKMVFNEEICTLSSKKIFTCAEIEGRGQKRKGSMQFKHAVDPAIVHFSSTADMTRYDKADLESLKEGKLSKQPPRCYYDPEIMRLNILTNKNRDLDEMDAQIKMFQEKLKNLSFTNFDNSLVHVLRNYHQTLLNPFFNSYQNPVNYQFPPQQPMYNMPNVHHAQQQYQSPRRVTFADKQQAVLDKIPPYDRNMNFFDNITTTATMRPPPRMGVNSYNNNNNNYQKRTNYNNNNNIYSNPRKPTSCANEHSTSINSSFGYCSGSDTKSFCEEPMMYEGGGQCEKRVGFFDQLNREKREAGAKMAVNKKTVEEEEKEPEWFSVPATVNDFIDLHGFDDVDGEKQQPVNDAEKTENQANLNRRNSFNNSYNRCNNNNNNNNSRNMNYKQSPNQVPANPSQKFRNPLHYSKPGRPPVPQLMNPFFDAWRSGKFLNQPNISFTDLMEHSNFPKNLPSSTISMSEVENRMKMQQNCSGFNQANTSPTAVPKFFQNLANNWGVRLNEMPNNVYYQPTMNMAGPPQVNDGYQMPTQEQLQQYTSEIMRNAILRKNQQYHDENNYQK